MFEAGNGLNAIARAFHCGYERIYAILNESGKYEKTKTYITTIGLKSEGDKDPITWEEIQAVRASIKPGDIMEIKTLKVISKDTIGNGAVNGYPSKAVVVSTDNKRFCIVRLPNGVKDSILWSTIAMERRKKKR